MSWPILLAEYPKSLFESKVPLIILVVLERSGLTTEDELAQQVRVNQQTLSNSLLDLHRNQFIVFGRNSIRISERGKVLLDRFQLHNGIVEDLLDVLSLQGQEREMYRNVVANYRDTSFPQYLNSLCTIRTWRTIAEQLPVEDSEKSKRKTYIQAKLTSNQNIMFTILLRDLRNWWIHTNPTNNIFENLDESIKSAITSDEIDIKLSSNQSDKTNKAITLLKILQSKTKDYWHSITKVEEPLVRSLIIFDGFQQKWEKDNWYESWCDVSPRILGRHIKANAFLGHLESNLPNAGTSRILVTFRTANELGSSGWWIGGNKEESITDFLTKMMLSASIDDLADVTGLSKDTVGLLLSNIHEKTASLLDSPQSKGNKESKNCKEDKIESNDRDD